MAVVYASAGLRIMGEGIDLDAISGALNLSPSHAHRRGEIDKLGHPYPQDMWSLNSPLGKREQLDKHLQWLVQQLTPHFVYLKSLKTIATLDIFCGYTSVGDGGLSLSPNSLSIFTELGLDLELSLILLRPKDESKLADSQSG